MNNEFFFKLGLLLGTLDDFIIRIKSNSVSPEEIERIKYLVKDVKKKFFALSEEEKNER